MSGPELRPLGVGEIIDGAIKLVTSNARVLFTISAVVFVPLGILQLLAYVTIGGSDMLSLIEALSVESTLDEEQLEQLLEAMFQLLSVGLALAVIAGIGSVLVQGATVKTAADVYQGQEPDWKQSIQFGFRRFFAILGAVLIVWVLSSIGLIFYIVPGVWLFVMWSVTVPALVVEHIGPIAAVQRSFRLVRGRFWPAFGVVLLSVLVYGTVSYLFSLAGSAFTLFAETGDLGVPIAASVISSTLSSIIVQPFIAAVLIVLYFDLRVRAEGYDLQVMAAELSDDTPRPPPPTTPEDPFGLGPPGT